MWGCGWGGKCGVWESGRGGGSSRGECVSFNSLHITAYRCLVPRIACPHDPSPISSLERLQQPSWQHHYQP